MKKETWVEFKKTSEYELWRKKNSERNRGENNPNYGNPLGYHHSEDVKDIIRRCSKQSMLRLRQNPDYEKWLHNRTKTPESREKRSAALRLAHTNFPEIRKKISAGVSKAWREHPERWDKLRQIMRDNNPRKYMKRISYPQSVMFGIILEIFPDAQLEYPLKVAGKMRWLDVAVPSRKLDFEYDGSHWHDDDRDRIRDEALQALGWEVIRVTGNMEVRLENK